MKGLNACESTVSSELVQWASVLLTAPIKEQVYLADICSSIQVCKGFSEGVSPQCPKI